MFFSLFCSFSAKQPSKEPEIKLRPQEVLFKDEKTKKILNKEPQLIGRAINKSCGKITQVHFKVLIPEVKEKETVFCFVHQVIDGVTETVF